MKEKAIVLLSGGMDSCVCAALAMRDYDPAFLHVGYGQRTAARELRSFHAICDHVGGRRRLVVDTPFFTAIGGSALTDARIAVPQDGLDPDAIPVTYVPFRNAHFLAMAVSWAEVLDATAVVIGAVAPDSSGYPDCRPAYYEAFNQLLRVGTKEGRIQVHAPLLHHSKAAIVRLGLALGAPFHLSWSCYTNADVACGRCDSCRLRLRAFQEAGSRDPVAYAKET
jgi:7-cyano-7-deazaguanine synthase